MSKFVPTSLGLFRAVQDGADTRFLFECPVCQEWLPFDEDILAGRKATAHELRDSHNPCSYEKVEQYGPTLVATLQTRYLIRIDGSDEGHGIYEYDEDEARQEMRRLYGVAYDPQ